MSSANWSRRPNLSPSAERREVGDVADHPGDAHAGVRCVVGAVVVAVPPRRVAHDRLPRDRVPGHALRVEGMRAGDRHDGVDLVGVQDRPLERLHAPERAAGHRREPLDPELVQERALRSHHVGDGDHREVETVRLPGRRVRATTAPSSRGSRRAGSWRRRSTGRCRTPCRGRSSRPTSRAPFPAVPSRSSAPNPSRVLCAAASVEKPAAWASPLSAWQTRITLSRWGESVP